MAPELAKVGDSSLEAWHAWSYDTAVETARRLTTRFPSVAAEVVTGVTIGGPVVGLPAVRVTNAESQTLEVGFSIEEILYCTYSIAQGSLERTEMVFTERQHAVNDALRVLEDFLSGKWHAFRVLGRTYQRSAGNLWLHRMRRSAG